MTEEKVKKRGWIKNVAIIFLAVLLVLTFFSNTFMNRSLPEVAAQYVTSGTVSAQIRGTGAVTPLEKFEVKTQQTRTVLSVPVQVGDTVSVGDTLVLFGEADSAELQAARDALDAAVLAYKQAVIGATDADYAKENRDIRLAQEALDQSKLDRDANVVSNEELINTQKAVNTAKLEVELQQGKVNSLQDQLSGMTPPADNSAVYAQIAKKETEQKAAEKELDAVRLSYKTELINLETYAKAWMNSEKKTDIDTYKVALAQYLDSQITETSPDKLKLPYGVDQTIPLADAKAIVAAYKAVSTVENRINGLKNDIAELRASISGGDWNYDSVKKQLQEAKSKLTSLQSAQTVAENSLETLNAKKVKYDEAVAAVTQNQKSLEDMIFALAEQRKADGKTQQTEALQFESLKSDVDKKSKALKELEGGGVESAVKSQVNGVVSTVNVSAGNPTTPETPLMVVEVPDKGYSVSFSVTTEQSKKVKQGDTGEVMHYYGGGEIVPTLVGIRPDPQDTNKKLLVFKLSGEVESGAQLSISIGERGANYDAIVPTTAIRTDSNGSFVLAVTAKSSALGNRYVASRVDVKVLASDDKNSAVSGGLTTSDFVITTSSKPIEPGMLVRLPD